MVTDNLIQNMRRIIIACLLLPLGACESISKPPNTMTPSQELLPTAELTPTIDETNLSTVQSTQLSLPMHISSPVIELAVSGYEIFAILQDGSAWVLAAPGPHQLEKLTDVISIADGEFDHKIALKSDGTVWAWGSNSAGQLGDGTTKDSESPIQVLELSGIIDVAAGERHSLALSRSGEVFAWGDNSYGQLGDDTETRILSPKKVTGLRNIVKILGCGSLSIALQNDGNVWGWGSNNTEIIGEVSDVGLNVMQPARISGINNIKDIACGNHILALKSDGTVWAWGGNDSQQLSYSSSGDPVSTPRMVQGLNNIIDIAAAVSSSFALDKNSTLWAWGSNVYFELGYGTPGAVESTPFSVASNVVDIAAGAEHGVLRKQDGTIWVWGNDFIANMVSGDILLQTGPVLVLTP